VVPLFGFTAFTPLESPCLRPSLLTPIEVVPLLGFCLSRVFPPRAMPAAFAACSSRALVSPFALAGFPPKDRAAPALQSVARPSGGLVSRETAVPS